MIIEEVSLSNEISLQLTMDDDFYFINVTEFSCNGYREKNIKKLSKQEYDMDKVIYSLYDCANRIINNSR